MPSQLNELLYAGKLIEHLRWPGHVHAWDDDPPDVIASLRGGGIVALEVRELHSHEVKRHGSPDREFTARCHRLLSGIRDDYYSREGVQRINVRAIFSRRPKSPALRELTAAEAQRDEDELCSRTLEELMRLPALTVGNSQRIQLHSKYGSSMYLHASHVPNEPGWDKLARAWRASPGAGWTHMMSKERLQEIVAEKDTALKRYRADFIARTLLLGAQLSGPGTYVDVPPATHLHPRGFDAVYFVRYYDGTRCIAGEFVP